MQKLIAALAIVAATALPAAATPYRAVDNGLMVDVPNVGYSRVETLNFCLNEGGAEKYQDLITDSDFVNFERCMVEMT